MKRTWIIYAAMAALAAVAIGAMAFVTHRAMDMERRQRDYARYAAEQEKVRLALWRMDAAATAIVAAESRHPPREYSTWTTFYIPDPHISGRSLARFPISDNLVQAWGPGPLLLGRGRLVRLHFLYDPTAGILSSPQAPDANQSPPGAYRASDLSQVVPPGRLAEDRRLLKELRKDFEPNQVAARLASNDTLALARAVAAPPVPGTGGMYTQFAMNRQELSNRATAVNYANNDLSSPGAAETPPIALWQAGKLLIVRGFGSGPNMRIAGAWMDWPAVENMLLGQVADLLPEARLEAVKGEPDPNDTDRLAGLPLRLVPGDVPVASASEPLLTGPLTAAWVCLLAALLAGAGVLRAVVNLGERRRAFVSAVTHELRTPLTTFRLYSEMLAGGMIADDAKRRDYLGKLRDESLRLSHLVENVLAYSRLSGPRRGPARQRIALDELVERNRENLADLARRAEMELVVEPTSDGAAGMAVEADVSAVEQILVNLVDNACKYASGSADRRVRVAIAREGAWGIIRVSDSGPGVGRTERRRLFRDFGRSAADAAGLSPGVGLGLAISRRLARRMGGDLRLAKPDRGATFALRLRGA